MATLHIRSLKHHLALPALATDALTSALMHPSTRGTCVPRAPACLGAHPQLLCHYLLDNLLALSIYYCTQARATSSSQLLLPSIIVRFSMKRARSNPHTYTPTSTNPHSTGTHPLTSSASTILLITMYSRFYLILFLNIACFFLPSSSSLSSFSIDFLTQFVLLSS